MYSFRFGLLFVGLVWSIMAAQNPALFADDYNVGVAVQDTYAQLSKFQWSGVLNDQEECRVFGALTEPIWNKICEKAFGISPTNNGVIYRKYLIFVYKTLLPIFVSQEELACHLPLTQHLRWLQQQLNSPKNPAVDTFLSGINWNFNSTRLILNRKFDANNQVIIDFCHNSQSKNSADITPDEMMFSYMICDLRKTNATKAEDLIGTLLERSAKAGVAQASYILGALAESERLMDKRAEGESSLQCAAKWYRMAAQKNHPGACAALAYILEGNPELASEEERKDLESCINTHNQLAIRYGVETACFNYSHRVEKSVVKHDEFGLLIQNQSAYLARLARQVVRSGYPNGLDLLGSFLALGKTNKDEYGAVIPEDLRIDHAMALLRKAVQASTEMGLYYYARCIKEDVFSKDLKGKGIHSQARNRLAGQLLQKGFRELGGFGRSNCLNYLATMVYNQEFDYNENNENIADKRVDEAIRMFGELDTDDAKVNYASLTVFHAPDNLSLIQKKQMYDKMCELLRFVPYSPAKSLVMMRAAHKLCPEDFIKLVNEAMEDGNYNAFLLFAQQFSTPHQAEPDEQSDIGGFSDDDHLDFADESEIGEVAAELTPAVVESEEMVESVQLKVMHREKLPKKVNEHKKRLREGVARQIEDLKSKRLVQDLQKHDVKLTWEKSARAHLDSLPISQRKERLPLLIEAVKEVNYSRMLLGECVHETFKGQKILYGNLSSGDRFRCIRTVENGKVTSIHVIQLKGHHND